VIIYLLIFFQSAIINQANKPTDLVDAPKENKNLKGIVSIAKGITGFFDGLSKM
jgi:hypothetical protein